MNESEILSQAEENASLFNAELLNFSNIMILALSLIWYLLEAYGLYKLAKNNGIKRPWLAWIPIAQRYLLGSLIGDEVWGIGHAGLILSLGEAVLLLLYFNATGILFWIAFLGTVVYYVYIECALYKFYKLYEPNKGILFFILGLLFPFTTPIWIFVLRKNKKYTPIQY